MSKILCLAKELVQTCPKARKSQQATPGNPKTQTDIVLEGKEVDRVEEYMLAAEISEASGLNHDHGFS